jgi:hypothetical protein
MKLLVRYGSRVKVNTSSTISIICVRAHVGTKSPATVMGHVYVSYK